MKPHNMRNIEELEALYKEGSTDITLDEMRLIDLHLFKKTGDRLAIFEKASKELPDADLTISTPRATMAELVSKMESSKAATKEKPAKGETKGRAGKLDLNPELSKDIVVDVPPIDLTPIKEPITRSESLSKDS